jgi:hypothetical protein
VGRVDGADGGEKAANVGIGRGARKYSITLDARCIALKRSPDYMPKQLEMTRAARTGAALVITAAAVLG